MKFKKAISILLGFSFLTSAFIGCGTKVEENKEEPKKETGFKWEKEIDIESAKQILNNENCSFEVNVETNKSNYVGINLSTDVSVVGTMYFQNVADESEQFTEDFFVKGGTNDTFCQIIDFYLNNLYKRKLLKIDFKNVSDVDGTITLNKICYGNKDIGESNQLFIQSKNIKLGIDLNAGGSINYLEYLNHNVQQVKDFDGTQKVGMNYLQQIGGDLVDSSVNLINEYDRGRLVQQSYYGSNVSPYECAQYIGMAWPYNPVQGGDYTGTSSQIVDIDFSESKIYIKVRPLDWAKVESITQSYMENTYTIENDVVKVDNVFTDWSEYQHNTYRDQELPAFYGILGLGTLVTYRGSKPFENEEVDYYPSLGNWVGSQRAYWNDLSENWFAWVNDDDFGVGLYAPDIHGALTGKVGSDKYDGKLCKADGTTYTALISKMRLQNYIPMKYTYYMYVGNVANIRKTFYEIHSTGVKNQDIIDARDRG